MEPKLSRVLPVANPVTLWPVLFQDDCTGTLTYVVSGTGADYSVGYDTGYAYVGLKGIRAQTRATTPTIGDNVIIQKYLWLPPAKLARLRLCYMQYDDTVDHYFYLGFYWFTGSVRNLTLLRTNSANRSCAYLDSAGSYQTISGATVPRANYVWSYFDLSVNLSTAYYKRAQINDASFDLSAYPAISEANATERHLRLHLALETQEAARAWAGLDEIIITGENL